MADSQESFPLHTIPQVVIQEVTSSWIPAAVSLLVNISRTLGSLYVTKSERGLNLAKAHDWFSIPHPAWWIVRPIPQKAVLLDCFAQEQKCNARLSEQFAWPSSASEIDGLWLKSYDSYHSVCHGTGGTESRSWMSGFSSLADATANFVRKPGMVWCLSYYICRSLHCLTLTPQALEEVRTRYNDLASQTCPHSEGLRLSRKNNTHTYTLILWLCMFFVFRISTNGCRS